MKTVSSNNIGQGKQKLKESEEKKLNKEQEDKII